MLDHQWLHALWRSIRSARPAIPARRRRRSRRHRSYVAAECLESRILPAGVTFTADTYEFTMTENDPNGAIGMVAADDPEGYGVMYWIDSADPVDDFFLDYDGTLYSENPPDFEFTPSYTLVIGATNGSTTDYATVIVHITNVDDEAPVFDQGDFGMTLPEDETVAPGTLLTTVTASDPDTDASELTYSLRTAGTPFSVSADGNVLIDGPLDYETGSWYDLEIEVSDPGGRTDVLWLTVELTDVDDEAPTVPDQQSFSIGDNSDPGAWVGTVEASDVDTDFSALTFAIVEGDDFGHFAIDACGCIYLESAVDYTIAQSYELTIAVSDGTNTTFTTVHVEVIFENVAPEITEFYATTDGDNVWTFSGRVEDDESPYGLFITFGGLLDGHSIDIQADGTFTYTVTLDPEASGFVTAQTTDTHGELSNLAETYI